MTLYRFALWEAASYVEDDDKPVIDGVLDTTQAVADALPEAIARSDLDMWLAIEPLPTATPIDIDEFHRRLNASVDTHYPEVKDASAIKNQLVLEFGRALKRHDRT